MLDLTRQNSDLQSQIEVRLHAVLEHQAFIMGPEVRELEEEVAKHLDVAHAIGVASGTDALLLVLKALDLQPGDEVITTPFTFFATAGAIHNAGGRPVFVDIEPATFNIDPTLVEDAVTERSRALIPVDIFGQMAAMKALKEIADRHDLFLLEDAAQAIGARQRVGGQWQTTGQIADAATFSFFPSKNLGGFGDGGMIVTNEPPLAERLRRIRVHGGAKMYHHDEVGTNSRLDSIQAAVLLAKLPHLAEWSRRRRANAQWYDQRLEPLERAGHLRRPRIAEGNESIFNQYTVRAQRRDELREFLKDRGVGHAVYYPVPLHLQPCFAYLGHQPGDFPESERAAAEVISIPIFPELREEELEGVADAIEEFYRG